MFKYMNLHKLHGRAYMDEVGAEGGEAGGGTAPPTITPEQFSALQESVAKLEAKNKELLQARADAKKAADDAMAEAARKNGDVDAIDKSWADKYSTREKELLSQLAERDGAITKITVGSEAQRLASELALPGSADVLLPHIERRLSVEIKDGQVIRRVLDKEGKPSALSIDDLRKEIENNPAFAPLIIGSKASGSGGVGGKGSPTAVKTVTRAEFDAMSQKERSSFINVDKGNVVD